MKNRFVIVLLMLAASLPAQNLGPGEELYLADPAPRFHGEQVEDLQRFLLFHGMDIGSDGVDGWFGGDTHAALLEYQAVKGLEQTGRIRIEEFSGPLEWNPRIQSFLFTGWPEGPFPGRDYDGEVIRPRLGEALDYASSFGRLTVPAEEIEREGYASFIHSPRKRFLAAFNGEKTSVTLWDLLTGTRIECPIEEAAKDSDYRYRPEEHTDFVGETITWWMDGVMVEPYQLTFVLFFRYRGPHQEDRSLITISPFVQQ